MPKAYRLVKMVLFGSQARGDADTGSDSIDITKEAVQTEKDLGFYEYTVWMLNSLTQQILNLFEYICQHGSFWG